MPPVDLPRGNAKAAPRVAVQAPTLPPIVLAPAPPARSYAPQVAARAYVAAPHRYSAPLPPPRIAPPPAKPASKAPSLPVQTVGGSPVRQPKAMSHAERLAQVIAAYTQNAMMSPLAPILQNSPLMAKPVQQMMYRGLFNQDYQRLQDQGLLPKDAKQPPLSFPDVGSGPSSLPYEKGSGGRGRIYVSPSALSAATDSQYKAAFGWGREIPLHELAHAMQTAQVQQSRPLREGSAQAYADYVAPAVAGPIATRDLNYTGFTNQARKRGPAWYMRGQFG